jgi:hypothetical protein
MRSSRGPSGACIDNADYGRSGVSNVGEVRFRPRPLLPTRNPKSGRDIRVPRSGSARYRVLTPAIALPNASENASTSAPLEAHPRLTLIAPAASAAGTPIAAST